MNDTDLTNKICRSIYYHSPIAIEQYDTNGFLLDCNLTNLNLFGVNDIDQVKDYNLFEEPNLNVEQKNDIKAGKNVRYEIEYDFDIVKKLNFYQTSKNGICYLDCFITSVKNEDKKIICYLLYILDITNQKIAEKGLKESETQLRELNATKDKFFSIISHDLKSPINSIIGLSNLLMKQIREKNHEGIEKYTEMIQKSSHNAMDLLANLLEWSRSQSGGMDFNPEYFEIFALINEVIKVSNDFAQQKSITISKELPNTVTVFADKDMVGTIMRNLISNAIKFTNTGGKIDISAEQKQAELIIIVSDNGVGIKKEELEKLFRIDEKYSTLGTQNEKGTGLGLILCKEFMEKHGGKIWAESEEGKGSEFKFTIPLRKN